MNYFIPETNTDFVCIVDRAQTGFAAVILSYLAKPDYYLPLFEFSEVTIGNTNVEDDFIDEHVITRNRTREFNILMSNSISKLRTCKNVILAGLSNEQRSYLDFPEGFNVIEIQSMHEVDFFLGEYATEKKEIISCTGDNLLEGLFTALNSQAKLKIDENANFVDLPKLANAGLMVVEKIQAVSTVIAIGYAYSTRSNVTVVDPLVEDEGREIICLIEEWRNGSIASYSQLEDKVNSRIGHLKLKDHEFITFFTTGLPYSLVIKNAIPCSYVHLYFLPDLFIFNNLFTEASSNIGAAVVFSPRFFKNDEETSFVIKAIQDQQYYVKELIGKEATVFNLDMHIKEFPFDILHICSHGGEVKGYSISEEFTDSAGASHTLEYDEVVGFAPSPGQRQIPVHRKMIWRKFDGLIWGSAEFKAREYPHYVFSDMQNALNASFKQKKLVRTPKAIIADSCSIQCHDFIYQAMFHVIAGWHTSPIIFNNTCWSWSGIAEPFLYTGARGYIGTLWDVNNDAAIATAKSFYGDLYRGTILNAIHTAGNSTKGSESEDIYIYWGLHFSTFRKSPSIEKSREHVCASLVKSFYRWREKLPNIRSAELHRSINELADWDSNQLFRYFYDDYVKMIAAAKAVTKGK